jgi:hypothetical protein
MGLCDSKDPKEGRHSGNFYHHCHVEERPNSMKLKRRAEEGDLCMDEDEIKKHIDEVFRCYDTDNDGVMEQAEVELMF